MQQPPWAQEMVKVLFEAGFVRPLLGVAVAGSAPTKAPEFGLFKGVANVPAGPRMVPMNTCGTAVESKRRADWGWSRRMAKKERRRASIG